MAVQGDRLGTLTATERDILRRLAAGHTAKSIAAETSLSVNAVNERLREARRKTGAASSRELARSLAAQENRDEQIGVVGATEARARPEPIRPHGVAGIVRRVWFPMITVVGLGVVGALLLGQGAQSGAGAADPLLSSLVEDRHDQVGDLHAQIRRQAPDPAWAPSTEAALRRRFAAVPGIGDLRILCRTSMCEVAGLIRPGSGAGSALLATQKVALNGLRDMGFADVASFAVGGETTGAGVPFVAYPRRLAADVPHVVATTPEQQQTIAAGRFTLSVTYDRPMRGGSYSFVTSDRGAYPDCDERPRRSADGRTFAMACVATPGTHYAIGFNSQRYRNFVGADGVPAEPALLSFSAR